MRKLLNFTLFLGLIILASCSSEIDMRDNPLLLPGQVKFTTTIGTETATRVVGNQWEAGDAIGVYALNTGSVLPAGTYGKENAKFTNPNDDVVGVFSAATPDDFITFPQDGAKLDFVAYYPYSEDVAEYKLPIDVSNQSDSELIDYLYVNNDAGANKSDPVVNLTFKHKMTQLVLEFSAESGMSLADLTAVIKGMKTDGSLNLADGSVTPGETTGDITPLFSEGKTKAVAIIVPGQNMEDVTVEIVVDGRTYTWTPTAEDLESGKRYTFNLKLTHDDVVLDNVGATIEDWEDANIGSDDIILNPDDDNGEEPEDPEEPVEPEGDLLFPGGDFEDWAAFLGGLNSYGLQDYAKQADGGRNGSKALHISGTPPGNDFLFTALVPEGFDPAGKNAIVFYMKGTAGKSLSLNIYKAGTGYQAFNLDEYKAERVIEPAANNQYVGEIDTGGDWMKVVVDISSVDMITTVGQNLFAVKVGRDAAYDLLLDDFTIESEDIKTFRVDKTSLSFAAAGDLSGTINLTSTEAWTATSSESWLTVSPASGSGSEAVTVTATENEIEESRSATVTFTAAGMDDIVVNVTQAALPGEVDPDSNLLFPGSDFNDWGAFTGSLNSFGVTFGKESPAGGRDGSGAMHFEGQYGSNAYVFTAVVPQGFSAAGKTKISFWVKGTAVKSLSMNVYVGDVDKPVMGDDYKCYNMDVHNPYNSHQVIEPTAANSYANGGIDTGGEWIQVTLDISTLAGDINTRPGADLFALKIGSKADYDLYIDDITIE